MAAASSARPSPRAGQGFSRSQETKSGNGEAKLGVGLGRRDSRICRARLGQSEGASGEAGALAGVARCDGPESPNALPSRGPMLLALWATDQGAARPGVTWGPRRSSPTNSGSRTRTQ